MNALYTTPSIVVRSSNGSDGSGRGGSVPLMGIINDRRSNSIIKVIIKQLLMMDAAFDGLLIMVADGGIGVVLIIVIPI